MPFLNASAKGKISLPGGGLYAITDDDSGDRLYQRVRACLAGGVRCLQYRSKRASKKTRVRDAAVLRQMTLQYGALFIVNDDIDLALGVEADGVHLGATDASVAQARSRLPDSALIGASCYNRIDLARRACSAGCDYLAFGAVNPSPSKPGVVSVCDDLLVQAVREFRCPVVAIGGIDPPTAARLWEMGIPFCAVISGIFATPDIRQSVANYLHAYQRSLGVPQHAWDNITR